MLLLSCCSELLESGTACANSSQSSTIRMTRNPDVPFHSRACAMSISIPFLKMARLFLAAIFFAAISTTLAAQTVSFTPVTQNGGGLQTFIKAGDLNND